MARRSLYGPGGDGNLDEAAEKEVAEWVAKTLGIKDLSRDGEGTKPGPGSASKN
jgi:hypothetical protein